MIPSRRPALLLMALLGLGATLVAAAAPPRASSDDTADFEIRYGVAPPGMVLLSAEQMAVQNCERLGPITVGEVSYVPEQLTNAHYELLLDQVKIQLLRQWADVFSVYNNDFANQEWPNAVLLTSFPTDEAFLRDGRWFATGFLLFCDFIDGAEKQDPTADPDSDLYPLDWDAETDIYSVTPHISFISQFDAPQRRVGEELMGYVSAMDKFFANEQAYYESSESHIEVTGDTVFEEGGKLRFSGDVRIKIGLPLTKKKLKLVFESDPDELVDGAARPLENTPGQAVRERSYFAGLQADYGEADAWRFRPSVGIKIRSPIDLFTRFRFSRNFILGSWIMRLNETFYWFDSIGRGEVSHAEFDYQLLDGLLFRSSSSADWQDRNDYFNLLQAFALIHKLGPRRAISYQVSAFGVSKPSVFVTDYIASVRYRQNIHSDYLFAELIPQVRFSKISGFEDEHSLTLRLELLFRG